MIDIQENDIVDIRRRLLGQVEGLQTKAVRSGLVFGSQPLKAAMRTLAPRLTGALARSIGHRQLSGTAKARAGVAQNLEAILVGPQNVRISARQAGRGLKRSVHSGQAWLVHILEETGAKAHEIYAGAYKPGNEKRDAKLAKKYGFTVAKARIGGRKRALTIRGGLYRSATKFPGFRPKPFIAPALGVAGAQMSDRFWEGVKRYLDRNAV